MAETEKKSNENKNDVVIHSVKQETNNDGSSGGINAGIIINCAILGGLEVIFLILFGISFKFLKENLLENDVGIGGYQYYAFTIVGTFGFYYSFLNDHLLASFILVFVTGVIGTQVNLLTTLLWEYSLENKSFKTYGFNDNTIGEALKKTIPIIVSLGAVLGRMSIIQYALFSLAEAIFYPLTEKILNYKLGLVNGGGSYMFIFGAFFGCAASVGFNLLKENKDEGKDKVKSSKKTMPFALIGLFLFVSKFPTLTNYEGRVAIGTVFGEFGALIGGIGTSQFFNNGKINVTDVFWSVIGGGVLNAAYSLTCGFLWILPLLSFLSGIIIIVCNYKLRPFIQKLGLFDVANVLFTFGIPAILGEFLFAIFISSMRDNIDEMWGSFKTIKELYSFPGSSASIRGKGKEGGYRIIGMLIVLALSIVPGFVVGLALGFLKINKNENLLEDEGILFLENLIDFNSTKCNTEENEAKHKRPISNKQID